MTKLERKDLKIYFLYFILLFPFFRVDILYTIWEIKKIYFFLTINSFFLILYLGIKSNLKLSKIILYIIFYFVVLGFSTVINNSDIKKYVFLVFSTVTFCIITEYGIKFYPKQFIKTSSIFLSCLVYINFFSLLLFSGGIINVGFSGNYWILGNKNFHILSILPAILFSYLDSYINKNKLTINNYILLFISFFSVILARSSGSIVAILIVMIYTFFSRIFENDKIFNIINYVKVNILSFFVIVIARLQNIFKFIIVNLLHKELSFTGRTYIWDQTLNLINEKKILGYGIVPVETRMEELGNYHSHNMFLEILYQSGIVGLLFYLIILFSTALKLYKNRKYKIVKFVSLMFFVLLTILLIECFEINNIIYIFIIVYNIDYLIDKSKTIQ